MLSLKKILNKFENTEIIFSDHNSMKLEINYRKETGENTKTWKLNDMLLNNPWVNKKNQREDQKLPWENENGNPNF